MSEQPSQKPDLGTRVFNGPFAIFWALFLFFFVGFVGTRIANALIVCWVRGSDAYLHQGIRVLKGRPLQFSDGMAVPALQEAVAFFGMFIVIVGGLSFLLIYILRFYEKHFQKKSDAA